MCFDSDYQPPCRLDFGQISNCQSDTRHHCFLPPLDTDAGASNSGSIHLSRSDIAASQNPVSSGGASGDGSHRNSYHFQSSSTGTTGGACVGVGTAAYVSRLRDEVNRLRAMLSTTQTDQLARAEQERSAVAENARLRKLLQAEAERRELVFRNFSGSESSLEMEDERYSRIFTVPFPVLNCFA